MIRYSAISYRFLYAKNSEKILKVYKKKEETVSDINIIGTCFCSILNSKSKVILLKQEFTETYINKYTNKVKLLDIKKIIDLIYNKLVNINKYFIILYNKFNKLGIESQMTKRLDKIEKHYNFYMKNIEIILDSIINSITTFEDRSINNLSFKNIRIPSCSMISILDGSKEYKYTYNVCTLNDLLSVSFYILCNHKYIIKQCQYCEKFFIALDNRYVYCSNSCPDYPSLTCKQVTSRRKIGNSDWQIKIENLERDRKNSVQFFTDNISRTNITRKKEMIKRNKQVFIKVAKDLNLLIRKSKKDDKYKYLEIYEKFIKDVRKNQKNSPPIFKVPKPKY